MRGVVEDLLAGCTAATISARFHNTLAKATVEIARAVRGDMPVVLSGGCFVNARLTESIVDGLETRVFMNRKVPPGDGGIALGQALIANARVAAMKNQEAVACV